jgi:hypothetical protein
MPAFGSPRSGRAEPWHSCSSWLSPHRPLPCTSASQPSGFVLGGIFILAVGPSSPYDTRSHDEHLTSARPQADVVPDTPPRPVVGRPPTAPDDRDGWAEELVAAALPVPASCQPNPDQRASTATNGDQRRGGESLTAQGFDQPWPTATNGRCRAHNPKVADSNPAPATRKTLVRAPLDQGLSGFWVRPAAVGAAGDSAGGGAGLDSGGAGPCASPVHDGRGVTRVPGLDRGCDWSPHWTKRKPDRASHAAPRGGPSTRCHLVQQAGDHRAHGKRAKRFAYRPLPSPCAVAPDVRLCSTNRGPVCWPGYG